MRPFALLAMLALVVTCGPDPNAKLPGEGEGTGGAQQGSGGAADTGGSPGNGGEIGTGGHVGTGGKTTGSGGKGGHGGSTSTGGQGGEGGATSTKGSGGSSSSGGAGGKTTGKGDGGLGSGGIAGPRDAATPRQDAAGSCLTEVVDNGYACGSAPPCSECIVNGTSKEAGCQKGIDCLAKAGPSCDNNCQLGCMNQAGDVLVQKCVTALQTAACPDGCGTTVPPKGRG